MAFGRFQNVGSASARVVVDLSQVRESVTQMRSLAQQITDSVRQVNQATASVRQPSATATGGASQARQVAQERANAERLVTNELQRQFQIAQSILEQGRRNVAEQANRFRVATAAAPQTVSRTDAETQLRSARQPIVALQADLARLRTAYLQATTPAARNALSAQLDEIINKGRIAANSMQGVANAVDSFVNKVQASRSGVTGYFTQVQQNLERINETSLAANLQEIGFRLLPLAAGAAALTARGVQTAQSLQEATISFSAFTGNEEEALNLMQDLTDQAHRFGQPMIETLETMQRFAPLIRQAGLELDDVFNLATRLATLNPAQGIQGALFAINEALAGQFRSLQTRFNLPTTQLRELMGERGFVGGLDEFLNQLGRTTEFAEQFGQTSRAAFTRLKDSVDLFLSSSMDQFLAGMTDASNSAAEFFNRLSEGPPIVQNMVGAVLALTSTLSGALLGAGQLALAFSSLKAVIGPLNIGGLIASTLPAPIIAAFAAAAPIISGIIGGAVSIGVTAGVLAIAATIGTIIGGEIVRFIASHVQIGTPEYSERLREDPLGTVFENAKMLIFNAVNAITEPLFTAAAIFQGIITNLGEIFQGVGQFFRDVLDHIGAVIANAIGGIEIAIGNALRSIGETLDRAGISTGIGLTGAELTGQGARRQLNVAGTLATSIQTPLMPEFNFEAWIEAGRQAQDQAMQSFLGQLFPTGEGTAVPAAGGLGGGGVNFQITADQLEEIQDLLDQITESERQFALETSRTMEDRALATRREIADTMIARSRALTAFNLQQGRAQEDYDRGRAQSIEDFNRQLAETEAQSHNQREKQQQDFQKQMRRAEEDHNRDMIRMARDVDNAISARNFLQAQDQIQKMRDAEDDFRVDQQRRREDFQEQIQELEDNLQKQQDARRADFERQLQRQEQNFQLQRQRQIADFARQGQLEEQDRQRRLQRQAQDFAIQDARRQQDHQRQINDMIGHNETMNAIWRNGLSVLRNTAQQFFAGMPALQNIANTFTGNTGSVGGAITGIANQIFGGVQSSIGSLFGLPPVTGTAAGGSGSSGNFGFQRSFQEGSWFVPATMSARVHRGEMIVPEPLASSVRRGEAVIGDGDIQINMPLQVINASGMDEVRLAEEIKNRAISEITRELQDRNRRNQVRRGMGG